METNINFTVGALVVDRSGSMWNIAEDVKGSVKQFINDQKKLDGKVHLRVDQFDHSYEVIHDLKDIQEINVDEFAKAYTPRGSTALLDAIGRATLSMQKSIEAMTEKPNRVVVAIITDGEENSSTEFNLEKIKGMVKEKEAEGWDFLFLASDLKTIKIAKDMGFLKEKTAVFEASNVTSSINILNSKFTQARNNEDVNFKNEERDEMTRQASVI
jgi:Mg-chelatase subunit ChlD